MGPAPADHSPLRPRSLPSQTPGRPARPRPLLAPTYYVLPVTFLALPLPSSPCPSCTPSSQDSAASFFLSLSYHHLFPHPLKLALAPLPALLSFHGEAHCLGSLTLSARPGPQRCWHLQHPVLSLDHPLLLWPRLTRSLTLACLSLSHLPLPGSPGSRGGPCPKARL